jgi:hypothetical protein
VLAENHKNLQGFSPVSGSSNALRFLLTSSVASVLTSRFLPPMHSARSSDSAPIGHRINHRRRHSPTNEQHPAVHPPPHSQSQTSLPSIRHLHPYLPPSGMSSQHLSGESSGYNYHTSTHYNSAPNTSQTEQSSTHIDTHMSGPQRESDNYGAGDSEAEGDADPQCPPKKKRRRQALSCTECKRRKIKCDRAQPCGPCTRRGEQTKCQWHIVEPIEKYVTRTEYDELKARFDHLEALVSQLFSAPSTTMTMPSYQMGMHPGMQGTAPSAAVPSYHPGPPPAPIVYQGMMPPANFPQQQQHLDTSPRYSKPESPREASSPRHSQNHNSMPPPATSPVIQTAHPPNTLSRLRSPPDVKSPISAHKQQSPLSLASITSPFNSENQSKNYHAQTLMLGERLRPGCLPLEGPVTRFNGPIQPEQRRLTRSTCL